jgi:hypothetical protein
MLRFSLVLRRQGAAEKFEKGFGTHTDEPGRVVAPMSDDPRLPPAVALSLGTSISKIEILDALELDMQPCESTADYVWAISTASELFAAPSIKTVLTEERREFEFTDLALPP